MRANTSEMMYTIKSSEVHHQVRSGSMRDTRQAHSLPRWLLSKAACT